MARVPEKLPRASPAHLLARKTGKRGATHSPCLTRSLIRRTQKPYAPEISALAPRATARLSAARLRREFRQSPLRVVRVAAR